MLLSCEMPPLVPIACMGIEVRPVVFVIYAVGLQLLNISCGVSSLAFVHLFAVCAQVEILRLMGHWLPRSTSAPQHVPSVF